MLNRHLQPQRRARRSIRAVALLCALVLVSGHALAAMGLCIAKAPAAPAASSVTAAEQAPCPQHVDGDDAGVLPDQSLASPHCPQDDPGAQVRAGDVPAAVLPLAALQLRVVVEHATVALRGDATTNDSPSTPLYARLSRLLL